MKIVKDEVRKINTKNQLDSKNDDSILNTFDKWGINYLRKERKYLLISGLFPLIIVFVQIYNMVLILSRFQLNRPLPHPPQRQPPFIDILSPIILLLIFAILACIYFIFLFLWNLKLRNYQNLGNSSKLEDKTKKNTKRTSLTEIMYSIVSFMRIAKFIFVVMNVICLFYLQWLIRFVLVQMQILKPLDPHPQLLIQILNSIVQIGLIPFMIYEWNHFLKWNIKLQKLEKFEQEIYRETEII